MNRAELVTSIAEKSGLTKKDSDLALVAFMDTVKETLSEGEKVSLVGFGTFEVRDSAERNGRNPSTGEEIVIPAGKKPKFKVGKLLKEAVKNS